MPYFNANYENHHPYAAKRLFFFRRHRAESLGKRSKRGFGIKFDPRHPQKPLTVNGFCGLDVDVNAL